MELVANFKLENTTLDALFQIEGGTAWGMIGGNIQNQTDLIELLEEKTTTFVFEQAIASASWVIEHNLNKRPSCTVVDTAGNVQAPNEITYNDENTMTVEFLAPFTGYAYLN